MTRTGKTSINSGSSKISRTSTSSMVKTISKPAIFKKSGKFEPVYGIRGKQGTALYYVENWDGSRGGFINSLMQEMRKEDSGNAKSLNIKFIVDQLDQNNLSEPNSVKKDGLYSRKYFIILHEDEIDNTTENLVANGRKIATVRILNFLYIQ